MRRLAIGMFLASSIISATPARADKVDRYVEERIEALHIPGLALAIIKDGEVVKSKGYGRANLETGARVTPETRFEVGSLTKQFTAFVLMMLVEEGRVDLDDSLTKHFPEAPASWRSIRLRDVLHHMSGIRNHVAVPGWMGVFKTDLGFETTPDRGALLPLFYALPLEFAPGESWAYDNTGYILLGWIIEDVSGQPLWRLMRDRIFDPLGMTATGPGDPRAVLEGRADGYEWVADHFENRPALPAAVASGAGALVSTIGDLAKWERALSSRALLSAGSYDVIERAGALRSGETPPFDYGFGWFVNESRGGRIIQHGGGTPGFASIFYRYPDDGVSVIALTNHADRVLDTLAIDIAGLTKGALKRASEGDADPATTALVRKSVEELTAGARDKTRYSAAMNLFLDSATGAGFWTWYASMGPLGAVNCPEIDRNESGARVECRVRFGDEPYWLTAFMTRENKIAQIALW